MNGRHYLLTVALSLLAALAGHANYGAPASPRPALAGAPGQSGGAEWEYCAVVRSQTGGTRRIIFWINYFKGEGVKTEPIEAGLGGNSFGKAVAKLGEEGWEMVGVCPIEVLPEVRTGPATGAPTALFFKRRKD